MNSDLKVSNYIENNYDLDMKLIREKYYHTFRVAMLTDSLTNSLGLNNDEKELAHLIALFHDLGRFREVVRSNEFNNLKFDHGSYSNKILFNDGFINNFPINEKDYLLIRKALYYHNKKNIGNDLNSREELFAKIIRDTDKIDILHVLASHQLKFFNEPNPIVLDKFKNNETIDLRDVKSSSDKIILNIGFYDNLYFKESKELLENKGYLDEFINSILVSKENEEVFTEIKDKVKEKRYVRY